MASVTVHWCDSHHPRDDEDYIRNSLEAGGDEGPLLVVPTQSGRRPGRSNGTPAIFHDVDHYLGHLAIHSEDLEDERFVALVRSNPRGEERENSLAALRRLQQTVAPGTDGIPVKHLGRRERVVLDHLIIPTSAIRDIPVDIEFAGDALFDVTQVYPKMKEIAASSDEDDGGEDEW